MKLSAILAPMLAAKVDHLIIEQVIIAYEAAASSEADKSKEKARIRWRKWKESHSANGSKRLQTAANVSNPLVGGDAPVEDKLLTSEIEPQVKKDTPRAALEAVLDAERATAVIDHRQRIRKPLTGHAAKLLANEFAKCPDPNKAADRMVRSGWTGFELEWMKRPEARGSPAKNPSALELLKSRRQEFAQNDEPPPDRPYLITAR